MENGVNGWTGAERRERIDGSEVGDSYNMFVFVKMVVFWWVRIMFHFLFLFPFGLC